MCVRVSRGVLHRTPCQDMLSVSRTYRTERSPPVGEELSLPALCSPPQESLPN